MKTRKSTKRALLLSVCSIVLCFVMLIGTTFAWFTDTASTAVSTITSGTLGIEIQGENNKPIELLDWQKAAEGKEQEILWEPGCTYTLTPFKLVNTGSLALKYKLVVTGLDGDSKLLDVIHFTYTIDGKALDLNEEGHLAANAETKMITISATMDTTAGNEYQGKTLNGVKFNVYATQDTVEYDSTTDQYDKDATYPLVLAADKDAFNDGKTFINAYLQSSTNVVLTDDIVLDKSITLQGENLTLSLDLNGHKLTVPQIVLNNAGTVEITDSTGNGEINFTSQNGIMTKYEGTKVILNGGTLRASSNYPIYSFTTDKVGSVVMLSNKGSSFVMNGGKIVADNDRSDVPAGSVAVRMYNSDTTFIMNGGEIEKNIGTLAAIQASGDGNTTGTKIEINGGSIKSNAVAIYHPQSGSLTVTGGYLAGETAIYAKSGTLNFAGGEMHATAAVASAYKFDGNGCYATGDAVVIDACGYPGGNPVVAVTGGTYTVTADGAHGFAHYKYNGNAATITNTAGIEIFEQ